MEPIWAMLELQSLGTSNSLPALMKLLTHRKESYRILSLLTIAHLVGCKHTPLYISALTEPWFRDKWAALHALQCTADPRAIPFVVAWYRSKRSAIRRGGIGQQTVFELAIFLFRFASQDPIAQAAFSELGVDAKGMDWEYTNVRYAAVGAELKRAQSSE